MVVPARGQAEVSLWLSKAVMSGEASSWNGKTFASWQLPPHLHQDSEIPAQCLECNNAIPEIIKTKRCWQVITLPLVQDLLLASGYQIAHWFCQPRMRQPTPNSRKKTLFCQIRIGDRSQPNIKLKFLNDQIENLTIRRVRPLGTKENRGIRLS